MVTAQQALDLLRLVRGAGADPWVDGGWGVDALLGRQTRPHRDLDVVLHDTDLPRVVAALETAGFEVFLDLLPTAVALRHVDGREIDLHPVLRTPDGGGDQQLAAPDPPFHYGPPASGSIGGIEVRCADAETQLRAHTGYPPRPEDVHDVRALATHVDLPLPAGYDDRPLLDRR